jgi:hypothetical protein
MVRRRPAIAAVLTVVAVVVGVVVAIVTMSSSTGQAGTPPQIASMSPVSGGGGTIVTLGGVGLAGTRSVTFGGVGARFVEMSPNEVVAAVPNNGKTGHVALVSATGQTQTGVVFTIQGSPRGNGVLPRRGGPRVTTIYPTTGMPGVLVDVRGVDLDRVASITLSGVDAPFAHAGRDDLRVMVPRGAAPGVFILHAGSGAEAQTSTFDVVRSRRLP